MIDIIIITQTVLKMHVIVNRSKNIFSCDMFWNQIMDIPVDRCLYFLKSVIFFQDFLKHRVIY